MNDSLLEYENAMDVIQRICEKLNVSAGYLIPKIAVYKITENVVQLIISAAVLLCMLKSTRFCFKKIVERNLPDDYDIWPWSGLVISGFVILIAGLFVMVAVNDLATWIAAPEVK